MKNNTNSAFFSKNLKYLIKIYEIKNVTLAQKIGISKSAISNYISGTSIPKRDVLRDIALFFNLTYEELMETDIEGSKSKISSSLNENSKPSYKIHVLSSICQSENSVFRNDNFIGTIDSPFPIYKDSECFAVIMNDNSMTSSGLFEGHTVFFATAENVSNNELAAVYIKENKQILIRRIFFKKGRIALSSDLDSKIYKYTLKDKEVKILGKVVRATFSPK